MHRAVAKSGPYPLQRIMTHLPLTRAQTDVWLAHHLAPDPSVLGVAVMVNAATTLDPARLQQAFDALVAGADAFRTRILADGPDAVAAVDQTTDTTIEIVDAPGADRDAWRDGWVSDRIRRPLPLDERLFDVALLRCGGRSAFYLNQHHIVTDVWSLNVALRRLAAAYNGDDSAVAAPARSFAEYVDEQGRLTQSRAFRDAEVFWEGRRANGVQVPALYGRVPSLTRRARAIRRTCDLGANRSERLRTMSAARGRGGNRDIVAMLVACFAAYQWRVAGTSPIAVGVPYHNRPDPYRDTIGLFVNVVPVVVELDGAQSFAAVAAAVRDELDVAFAHAHYPLAHTVSQPLYHSTVNYHVRTAVTFDGVPARVSWPFAGHLDECLGLEVRRNPDTDAFVIDVDLDGDVFAGRRGADAVEHFLRVLDTCLGNPDRRIDDADLVTPGERAQLGAWSVGPAVPLRDTSVISAIQRHVETAPDRAAVVAGGRTYTYAQLSDAARRTASAVQGVAARGTAVGVMVERSFDGLTAILGVLLAGCGYVPLDEKWPDDRLAFLIGDASIGVVVTSDSCASRLRRVAPTCEVLIWHQFAAAAAPVDAPRAAVAANDLAYIIYTSGSTGQPKGVAISHHSLSNHCIASLRAYGIVPTDRVLQFHALTFDASIEEIFPTWVAGAAIVLRSDDIASDFESLERLVDAEQLTVIDLPTSYWHEWTRSLARRRTTVGRSVRIVIVGGEQPSTAVLAEWRRCVGPDVRWVNGYGPTETTVTATVFDPETRPVDGTIPMGRPVANVTVQVLDERRRSVPPGVIGELYVGGAGVARGYVNRPDLNAERFVMDGETGARFYRTGDLARFRDDGQLEYLGRADDQVKVRGFRIELAEVEYALQRHPSISHAAVLVRDDEDLSRLVAYVVTTHPVDDHDIQAFLKCSVPDYMVPNAMVRLDALPLTANGKVNRKALADLPLTAHRRPSVPAKNPIEAQIIEIWKRLFGTGDVQRDDSFVALGGHSLLAARVIHELTDAFSRKLPLATMFPDTTPAALARAVHADAGATFATPIALFNEGGSRPLIVYFHGDYGGAGLYAARLVRLLGPDYPVAIVHPHGIDGQTIPATIEAMARDRLDAVRSLIGGRPAVLAGFCNGGLVAYEIAGLLERDGERVCELVLIDTAVTTTRYRWIDAALRRYPRRRPLSDAARRDAFLRWRDRQATVEHLLGTHADSTHHFQTVGDRVRFVLDTVRRKAGLPSPPHEVREPSAAPGSAQAASDAGVPEELWRAYGLAIGAYVPRRYRRNVTMIASDELSAVATASWRRLAPALQVTRVPGLHLSCVTTELPSVAAVLRGATHRAQGLAVTTTAA
jgi:amino acid adenylation domain-containing protein